MAENNYAANGMITSYAYTSDHPESIRDFESRVIKYHLETNTASLVKIGALKAKFGLGRQRESGLVLDVKSEKK